MTSATTTGGGRGGRPLRLARGRDEQTADRANGRCLGGRSMGIACGIEARAARRASPRGSLTIAEPDRYLDRSSAVQASTRRGDAGIAPDSGSPERVQEKSSLRLSEEQPADEYGDDDERQWNTETQGEPGAPVGQEISDPDPAPRPDGGAHRSTR